MHILENVYGALYFLNEASVFFQSIDKFEFILQNTVSAQQEACCLQVLSVEVTHKVRTCQDKSVVQQGMLYRRPSMRVPAASWGRLRPRVYLGPTCDPITMSIL